MLNYCDLLFAMLHVLAKFGTHKYCSITVFQCCCKLLFSRRLEGSYNLIVWWCNLQYLHAHQFMGTNFHRQRFWNNY